MVTNSHRAKEPPHPSLKAQVKKRQYRQGKSLLRTSSQVGRGKAMKALKTAWKQWWFLPRKKKPDINYTQEEILPMRGLQNHSLKHGALCLGRPHWREREGRVRVRDKGNAYLAVEWAATGLPWGKALMILSVKWGGSSSKSFPEQWEENTLWRQTMPGSPTY